MPDHWCKVNDTTIDAKWATANTNVFLKSFELKWLDLRSASSEITMALNIMISSAWWTHSYDSFSIYLALICSQCWCKLMLIAQAVYNLRWNCSIGFIAENKNELLLKHYLIQTFWPEWINWTHVHLVLSENVNFLLFFSSQMKIRRMNWFR